jgi:hypothetical protein
MAIPALNAPDQAFSKSAFLFLDQDLALSGVIGLADDAFEFHPLHQ